MAQRYYPGWWNNGLMDWPMSVGEDMLDRYHGSSCTLLGASDDLLREYDRIQVQWYRQSSRIDGFLAGVIADWLEDHRDQFYTKIGGNATLALDGLIQFYRKRFENPAHNVVIDPVETTA